MKFCYLPPTISIAWSGPKFLPSNISVQVHATARQSRNQSSNRYFTTEAQSSQSSEYFLIKNFFSAPSVVRQVSPRPEPVEGRASALKIVADQPQADSRESPSKSKP